MVSAVAARADVLVCGAGSAGSALAGILARERGRAVVLCEAGPDMGALHEGRWLPSLLDGRRLPFDHDWGYRALAHPSQSEPTAFRRGRLVGGCSAVNGCVALAGHRLDYDAWEATGNVGWSWNAVEPAFERARHALRVRVPDAAELTPFHQAFMDAAVAAGIPRVRDLDDPDGAAGVGLAPVNIHAGIRWNSSFAFLDPVRGCSELTVLGDTLVDRVIVEGGRAVGVEAIASGRRVRLMADRVVLAAGAYGSPAILLRSGIGPANAIKRLGVRPMVDLRGVGRNLADHPTVRFRYRASDSLRRCLEAADALGALAEEQTLAKARSTRCSEAFDLHLYSVARRDLISGDWICTIAVAGMSPRSTGSLAIYDADPTRPPQLDHGYLADTEEDISVLSDGVKLARDLITRPPLAASLGSPISLPYEKDTSDVGAALLRAVGTYAHPAGTCHMGSAADPLAVVNHRGQVYGLEGLYVCDASIFPTLMRANTNMPAVMLAEHLAHAIGKA